MTTLHALADTVSDRAFALLVALLLHLVLGRFLPNRLAGVQTRLDRALQRFFQRTEAKLNKQRRSVASRRWRGALIAVAILGGTVFAVMVWFGVLPLALRAPLEVATLVALLPLAPAFAKVREAQYRFDVPGSGNATARYAVEMLARALVDRAVPMAVWFVVLGLPGLALWLVVHHAYQAMCQPVERLKAFGGPVAMLHAWVTALPRVAGALVACIAAAFVPGTHPMLGWATAFKHPRFLAEGAFAGLLERALVGPRAWQGQKLDLPWIGDGTAKVVKSDVHRARRIVAVAMLLLAAGFAVLAWEGWIPKA